MKQITKNNKTYEITELYNLTSPNILISWLETNNPLYVKFPSYLFNKNYTGIIKVYEHNKMILQIKIYEGYFIKIIDYQEQLFYYLEDNKIPLEIREYEKYNRINIRYIYDTYIIKYNLNNTIDILYKDTMEQGNFELRDVKLSELNKHQMEIYNKFNKIIKETKNKINDYTYNI